MEKYINNLFNITDVKINNLTKILINFYENKLSDFQLILFIISNNLSFSSNNEYFIKILADSKSILEVNDFIGLEQTNFHDSGNLKNFLEKYPKFKDFLYKKTIPNINFTLNYNKKNIDDNLVKLINLKPSFSEIQGYFKNRIKFQMETIFNNKLILSNEKIYRDYTIRLFYKMNLNDTELDNFNKYNFFRNFFCNIKWEEIVNNFNLINIINKNSHILLYYGKLNNVIFENNTFKNLID